MTNPLLLPPLLLKRALDDLHDLAGLARGLGTLPDRIDGLHKEIRGLRADLKPMEHLGAVRESVAPLERAITSVREAVDELEPMISEMDESIRALHPRLESIQASVEPIGTLADRLPGSGRNRA